jgi:hypothetical protein
MSTQLTPERLTGHIAARPSPSTLFIGGEGKKIPPLPLPLLQQKALEERGRTVNWTHH